jgi:hypothetical protein
LSQPDLEITVIDVGAQLPEETRLRVKRLRRTTPDNWSADDRTAVTTVPAAESGNILPEKAVLGSTYPFDDLGQMTGVRWSSGTHVKAVSGGMGGFSNVWGAQAYPFTERALTLWPDQGKTMEAAYRNVVHTIPVAGQQDELATVLPTYGDLLELPELAERTRRLLAYSTTARERLASRNLVVGAARVGFRADKCVSCGLCNSGCVWDLLFSSRQLFSLWIAEGRIRYHRNTVALSISAGHQGQAIVTARTQDGVARHFAADRVFLGAGAVGSTRIVLNSLPEIASVSMLESRQVVIPLWSRRSVPDPQTRPGFTVAQAGMMISSGSSDEAFLQFYPYDPTFIGALPAVLRRNNAARRMVMQHLSVGIAYLNSDRSPTVSVRREPPAVGEDQARIALSGVSLSLTSLEVRRVIRSVLRASSALDLWPIYPAVKVSSAGRSYHLGGSFPYSERQSSNLTTDRFGRLRAWSNVHLIDAATFPALAPTGFLLTIMANANRIAREALDLEH